MGDLLSHFSVLLTLAACVSSRDYLKDGASPNIWRFLSIASFLFTATFRHHPQCTDHYESLDSVSRL